MRAIVGAMLRLCKEFRPTPAQQMKGPIEKGAATEVTAPPSP